MFVRPLLLALAVLLSGCVLPNEDASSFPTVPVAVLFNQYGEPVTVTVTTYNAAGEALDAQRYEVAGSVETPPPSMDPGCATMTRVLVRVESPERGLDRSYDTDTECTDLWHMVFVDRSGRIHVGILPQDGPDAVPGWERGDDWPEDVRPERYFPTTVPSLSFTKSSMVRDGRDTTVFTVTKVTRGPLLWQGLDMECTDGTGPEAWGGSHEEEAEEVRAGNRIYCDGSELSIVHAPTDTLLYRQPL